MKTPVLYGLALFAVASVEVQSIGIGRADIAFTSPPTVGATHFVTTRSRNRSASN
jgi:hypothetical protein